MNDIMKHARDAGKKKVSLHVRESNDQAIQFYKAIGFTDVQVIGGYYAKTTKESAFEMEYDIEE